MKLGEPGFWIDTAARPAPRAALDRDLEADVAIVGAGYTGLWTAYYLLRQEPSLKVVLLERDFAGAGASGRNGGWVSGFFSGPPRLYDRAGGPGGFNRMQRIMFETVDEIGAVLEREGIEADWVKGATSGSPPMAPRPSAAANRCGISTLVDSVKRTCVSWNRRKPRNSFGSPAVTGPLSPLT